MHINQETHLTEIWKEGEDYKKTGAGELLVTTLELSPMPFIRYRMGDVGEVTESNCSCGRSLQILSNFLGRTGEVFITRDGRMISPNFWCRTFMNEQLASSVKRFQVVYLKNGNIRIKLVKNNNYVPETETQLKQFLQTNFQSGTGIEFEYVLKIDPQI